MSECANAMTVNHPTRPDDLTLLLWYVHERDAPCPRCGYNLRNLTRPVCPECREELWLAVRAKVRLAWLFAAIAPGVFSVIAAPIVLADLVYESLALSFPVPALWWASVVFGFASGALALGLILLRDRFCRQPGGTQVVWVTAIWAVHITLFMFVAASTF